MSKAIILPAKKKSSVLRQAYLKQQASPTNFKPKQHITPEFNEPQDPLSYRNALPAPPAAKIQTGYAFLDTSMRLVYEKKDDPKSPLRGIRFNSHGLEFRIEKANILGSSPLYEAIVLSSASSQRTSYRMTPADVTFVLSCMEQECDLVQDKKLADLYGFFKKHAPSRVLPDKKVEHKLNHVTQGRSFEFVVADRTYYTTVPQLPYYVAIPQPIHDPKFFVKGFDERNTPNTRFMTRAEIKYNIDRIINDTPRNDMVAISPAIQRMRDYLWDLADLASARAIHHDLKDVSGTRGLDMS